VLTDRQSLKWLQAIKNPTGRLTRCAIFLQQHDFDIRYRRGILNQVADALFRQPPAAEDETAPEDLLTLEDAPGCTWYTKMRREVEKNPAAHPDYCIRDERLHRHFWDMADSTEPELSDPKPARAAVLRECHDAPTAGHLGIAKTTARLVLRYYWPGMFREAAQYVRSCPSCQRYKTPQQQPSDKMYPTPNRQTWETVSTDLLGPLPRSSRGNCYVLVLENLLASRRGKPTIIAGDLNGRYPAFGGEEEDARDRQIIDLVGAANLLVENDRESIPTFETANEKSWIDITLSRDARMEGWVVREEETLSEHRSISFSVDIGEMGNDQPKERKKIHDGAPGRLAAVQRRRHQRERSDLRRRHG
jgi:hypothetical protein